ncbi:gamma-glutamyltransferase family protein [Streptomyces sclerotialus]|uniref:gamma-glutamyltransferase family protein n=1 Tax=Streptomyces sclerotialus TaxID=1957 RepID=UPI0004C68E14
MLSRPELKGARGAVAATHWLAAAAGMDMLSQGGNAFDAAVAAAFVTQVVEPHLNGPAGDVPILAYDARTARVDVICGQGPMPRAATIEAFRDQGLAAIPGSGLLAACVPGAFGAWMRLLRDHGRLTPAQVLAPAIGYAEKGFPILPKAAQMIDVLAPLFREEWTESGRTYLRGGKPPAAGARTTNPELARTFRLLAEESQAAGGGRERQIEAAETAFYEGFVAEAIDKFVTGTPMLDATGQRHAGLLTGDDMASWRATVEAPLVGEYRGHTVHKSGPWSQGPVFLQQLALLEGFDLSRTEPGSADHLHTVVECAKLAFADREAWYGDPDHTDVPVDILLSAEYAAARRALVEERASLELRPGSPGGRIPVMPPVSGPAVADGPEWLRQLGDGIPAIVQLTQAKGDTCCVSATDSEGNMVVATPSGGWLKSSPVVPGLGFPLGTRGQMANLVPGHPNAVAPGKRPRTTLSPTLVLRDGEPYMAFGTPGGDQQDQWTLNFFLQHVDFGSGVQEAVEAPAFHTDAVPSSFTPHVATPGSVVVEHGCPERVVEELRWRGHVVRIAPARSLGKVCATGRAADGLVFGAASPRGEQAYAVAR